MKLNAYHKLGLACLGALFALGCGDGRDVELSGEIAGVESLAEDESLRLVIYEPELADAEATEDDAATTEAAEAGFLLVDELELEAPGAFEESVSVVGEEIYAVAFVDSDGDGACTAGEAWGDATVLIAEDDTAALDIEITPRSACPSVPMAE